MRLLYNEAAKDRHRVGVVFSSRGPGLYNKKVVPLSGVVSLRIQDLKGGSAPSKSLPLPGSAGAAVCH